MSNLDRFKNAKMEIWLNVASSTNVLEHFVNIDNHIFLRFLGIYSFVKPILPKKYWGLMEEYRKAKQKALLLRHDCRKLLFLPDNSVDHILCSHFLEHVFPVEMDRIIGDFCRVLRNNGTLHVIVPDLLEQARRYLAANAEGNPAAADQFVEDTLLSRESRGSFRYRLLEFHGGLGLQHRWMYDYASMAERLRRAGFSILERNETPSKEFRLNDGSVHVIARKR